MTYPMNELLWIAPTFFILLLIAAPVIGVFAGWKRAAYWGGATLFFFIIGSIIWRYCGAGIITWSKPQLTQLISSISPSATITDRLLISVAAPIFFVLYMLIIEIILIINYYTWFKKVSRIQKDIDLKKAMKAAKNKQQKAKCTKKLKGWTAMQFTTKGKIINMASGGLGLAVMLASPIITFSQALLYTTTSVETRANSKFVTGLYNSLQKPIVPFSWMSFYGTGDTGKDYNSLFSLLHLTTQEVEYTYLDPTTGEIKPGKGTVPEALANVISGGVQTIIRETTEGQEGTETVEERVEQTNESITSLAHQWNNIVDNNTSSVNSVFGSESISEILKPIIGDNVKEKQTLTEDQIVDNFLTEGSVFNQVYDYYIKERAEEDQLTQISVSQETFNNIVESFKETFEIASGTSQQVVNQFYDKLNDITALMFTVA